MEITVQIASIPDRENIVAELWQGGDMIAEVQQAADGGFTVEIYAKERDGPWRMNLDDLLNAFKKSVQHLSSEKKIDWGHCKHP